MSLRFAVVHEAPADFQIATELADREIVEAIDWLEGDQLQHHRTWLANTLGSDRLTWSGMKALARDAGVRVHGHFDDPPGLPDAAAARRAIVFLLSNIPYLDAIVLIRDQDDQPERRHGLEQARRQHGKAVKIVVGLAVVERESWVISGFDPQNPAESARLDTERQSLGFDPRIRSHELTACKKDQALRSAKRVLRQLVQDDLERERRCWREIPLSTLRERGGENGLAAYLQEVRVVLAPAIGHTS